MNGHNRGKCLVKSDIYHHERTCIFVNISEIKVRKIIPEGKLRGVVSITIDDVLAVHDIKIVQGEERLFVAMPSRRDESGLYRDIVHPINSATRSEVEREILSAFQMEVDRQSAEMGINGL
jgi:stage V sporulation protein G